MNKKLTNSKLSLKLFTVLHRATAALDLHALAQIQSCHLGETDFAILEVLLHKGSLPISTIGSKVLLTNGSMTTAVDRLEAKRLVKRVAHETDRRTKLVQLTQKGRDLIEPVFAEHALMIERATSGLTTEEKSQFIELAKKLGKFAASLY
jgi:MarR family 2-MHQ and catechol resistance regulon transcriptional repressor